MYTAFSPGAERLLQILNPWGRREGSASFPPGRQAEVPRTKGNETVQQWFRRAVDQTLGGEPSACGIEPQDEPQLGIFASVKWRNDSELTYASIHAVMCRETLVELYLDERAELPAYYLRLDYDLDALGELFSHPHPHIHATPWQSFALRFPQGMGRTGNVIVDFIDFLYRSFFHANWMEWARNTWELELERARSREENQFEAISKAFRRNELNVLNQEPYASTLNRMKRVWQQGRDALLPLRGAPDVCRLLSLHDW